MSSAAGVPLMWWVYGVGLVGLWGTFTGGDIIKPHAKTLSLPRLTIQHTTTILPYNTIQCKRIDTQLEFMYLLLHITY